MNVDIAPGWKSLLSDEFEKPYFRQLTEFVRQEYRNNRCYPGGKEIFAAFDHSPLASTKVVIIGQDPYHGPGQANGLSFSVADGIPHPPSLVNIFKELQEDVGAPYPHSGNLQRWADQGVLLLNATLTVRAHQAGSHQGKGWETFTDSVIRRLGASKSGIIFLLWGGYARKKAGLINPKNHHILTSGHPSPLSANRGLWFGNKHFSKANALLKQEGKEPINW